MINAINALKIAGVGLGHLQTRRNGLDMGNSVGELPERSILILLIRPEFRRSHAELYHPLRVASAQRDRRGTFP